MLTIATATMPLTRPGPSAAMIAIASRKYGNAISVSIPRMTAWSTQRPVNPARSPHAAPVSAARPVDASPTRSEMRAPPRGVDGVGIAGGEQRSAERGERDDDHQNQAEQRAAAPAKDAEGIRQL